MRSMRINSKMLVLAVTVFMLLSIVGVAAAADYPAWDEDTVYTGGDRVTHDGSTWEAKWWTLGEEPGTTGEWGVWKLVEGNPDPTVPATPAGLSATAASTSEINVSWDSVADATGYDLEVDGQVITDVTNPYAHTGLQANTTHSYRIRAKNEAGASDWSSEISATTEQEVTTAPAVPATPAGLSATAASTSEINVSWDSVADATGYDLEVDGQVITDVTSPYAHTGLQANTSHDYRVRAKNKVGVSDWSSLVSATTTDGSSSDLNKVVVGYWHNFDNGSTVIKLRDVSKDFDVINVSFAEPISSDRATMGFEPFNATDQEFKSDIQYLNGLGKKVLISIGGANGTVELNNEEEKQSFITTMINIIEKYGFNGMDIDLEGSSLSLDSGDTDFKNPTTPKVVNLIDAVKEICAHFGPDFMLTMAPETVYVQGGYGSYGGPWGAYLPVIYALRNQMDYIHVQHYNSGSIVALDGKAYSQGTADFHVAMGEMLLQGFPVGGNQDQIFPALRADQVAFGIPACPSAAGGGYTEPAKVKKALDYLIKGIPYGGNYQLIKSSGYPEFRGIMTWSINWDAASGYEFSTNYGSYFNNLN